VNILAYTQQYICICPIYYTGRFIINNNNIKTTIIEDVKDKKLLMRPIRPS
jgi:hypothetical protein